VFLPRKPSVGGRWTIRRAIPWIVLVAACAFLLWMHIVLFRHSGSFWRDETSSIQLARAKSGPVAVIAGAAAATDARIRRRW
jgi:hypothetical protein